MARRHTQVFYPAYQSLVTKLLDRPWVPEDGMDVATLTTQIESSVAAQQLAGQQRAATIADIAPLALQEFYLALGVSEMMETNHFFFDPDELELRDDMVMFVEDADEANVWGIPLDQVDLPDPIIWIRSVGAEEPDGAGEWESTQTTISELIADMLIWNYTEDDVAE